MRPLTALALVSSLTATAALAEDACPLEHAVYGDGELGYRLTFRPGKPWEMGGMTEAVFELSLPDGRELWGSVAGNMGTSRDVGSLYEGCQRPGPDDAPLDEAAETDCRVWHNNVYALTDGRLSAMPFTDEPAPPSLVLADLGRALRYTVLSGPGEEPWDQFDLIDCQR